MHDLLKPGQVVQTTTGLSCVVERLLGGGGQGEVYRAALAGQAVALKWYFPETATPAQWATLERLITQGPPTRTFLWPADLVKAPGIGGFGYVMPLREARYKGLIELMKRRVEPSFRTLTTVGLELTHSYLQLHTQGLCYRDISFGNVFFDPETGEVLICDNDNVAIDGVTKGGVLGTPRFMAPEIVRGEALPSTQTDLYSLSVLLFYLLMMHHPLEGKREAEVHCLDLPAMTRLYGMEPLFIFDPENQANAPDPALHQNAVLFWPLYPQFLRDLFVQAFTEGLCDPQHGRVRESAWRHALARLRDAILYCALCGAENFYHSETSDASGGKPALCWACQNKIILPTHLAIGKQVVMLNHDTQLFPHHVDAEHLYDFTQPIAAVTRHPTDPRIWGLQNLSAQPWTYTLAGGQVKTVPSGRSVTLVVGTRIHFGNAEGEIRR